MKNTDLSTTRWLPIVVAAWMVISVALQPQTINPDFQSEAGVCSSQTPISIVLNSDAELTSFPNKTGTGTSGSPYIISNLFVTYLTLFNITLPTVMKNCTFSEAAFLMYNCSQVTVFNCTFITSSTAVDIKFSSHVNITNVIIPGCSIGILTWNLIDSVIDDCTITGVWNEGMEFVNCTNVKITNNMIRGHDNYYSIYVNKYCVGMSISNNDLEKDPYFEQSYFDWNAFFIQFMAGVLYVLPNVAYAAVFFFGGTVLVFGVMSLITYPFTRAQQKAMLRTKKADTIWKVASFILWYGSSAMFLLIEPILNRPISSVNFLWFLNVAPLRFVGMTWLSPVIVISLATIVLLYFIKKGRNGKVLDKGISKAEPGPVDNGAPGDLDLMVPPS